ncbi:hypothetical protein BD310DRAFT_813760 [Dichomitus squalens]|uniref:DUF6533 domain-containing protein n=1 Tax=Dichomitus squalens TaxID=114155 RepID=A0A4V6MWV6_9APHY|nr:hypothetical protein BD310DRAFT_813760 [Dichomitus squalens]
MHSARVESTLYIRVVALSIALYDYLLTLPAEWRFYRSQRSWRLSPGCILFIAIRYTSVAVLVTSNVGFFSESFTPQGCKKYYIIPPVLKVVQIMISQLILGIRTINISRRAPRVFWTVVVAFISVSIAEAFLNLSNRVQLPAPPAAQGLRHNCTAGNKPPKLTVWLFYVFAMIYDLLVLGISTFYLIGFGPNFGKLGRLVRIMLTDGLVYFVALTGVNIANLILYRSSIEAAQSSGVTLGYALTWIMSQRILIHLRDAAAAHNRPATTQIVVSRPLASAHSVSRAMRSQFDTKASRAPYQLSTAFDMDVSLGDWSLTSPPRDSEARGPHDLESQVRSQSDSPVVLKRGLGALGEEEGEGERGGEAMAFEVEVQVEETVTVEYEPAAYETESYRTPRVLWSREQEQEHAQEQERTEREQRRQRGTFRGDGRGASRLSVLGERSNAGKSNAGGGKRGDHLGDGSAAGT